MKYECDMMDSRREGKAEGEKKGFGKGVGEARAADSLLADALAAANRLTELPQALKDTAIFNKLCEEFGIENPTNEVVGA